MEATYRFTEAEAERRLNPEVWSYLDVEWFTTANGECVVFFNKAEADTFDRWQGFFREPLDWKKCGF